MMHKDKLNGSQRQRGLYLNAGSSDAGVDPGIILILSVREFVSVALL